MRRREKMLCGLDLRGGAGLEIGALDKPILRKPDENVVYIDHADHRELLRKYEGDEAVSRSEIVDVDFVWQTEPLARVLEGRTFDFAIASHVVEHVPDLIWWLGEIATVLRPFGSLRLAVPDKRFTFDFLRRETDISDILSSWLVHQRRPGPKQIIEFWGYYRPVDAAAAWRGDYPEDRSFHLAEIPASLERARGAVEVGAYHDTHCSVLTPASFVTLMRDLVALDLSEFSCTQIEPTDPGELEFFVHLMKTENRDAWMESWRWAEWVVSTADRRSPSAMPALSRLGSLVARAKTAVRPIRRVFMPDRRNA